MIETKKVIHSCVVYEKKIQSRITICFLFAPKWVSRLCVGSWGDQCSTAAFYILYHPAVVPLRPPSCSLSASMRVACEYGIDVWSWEDFSCTCYFHFAWPTTSFPPPFRSPSPPASAPDKRCFLLILASAAFSQHILRAKMHARVCVCIGEQGRERMQIWKNVGKLIWYYFTFKILWQLILKGADPVRPRWSGFVLQSQFSFNNLWKIIIHLRGIRWSV